MVHKGFKPSTKMKLIYRIYLLAGISPLIILAIILLALKHYMISLVILVPTLCLTLFVMYWISKFYDSIKFSVEDQYAYAKFGVWWKREKRVPYHLVS